MADILFVDDESPILNSMKRIFRGEPDLTCHFASSAAAGLEIMKENVITVVVSDHRMPGMTGAEFLALVKNDFPEIIRIMLTGQADLDAVKQAVNEGAIFRFIVKPWDDDELRLIVRRAIEYSEMRNHNRRLQLQVKKQNKELTELNDKLEEKVALRTSQLKDALYTAQHANASLEASLFTSAKAFFSVIELVCPEIGSHSRRVAEHVMHVVNIMDLPDSEKRELEVAALLHDIGKVNFPTFMLEKKPEDYSQEEMAIYKYHPQTCAEVLNGIYGYDTVIEIVKSHHERYNGSGFPRGLKKNQIPDGAYIIGLLDAYDHLRERANAKNEFAIQYLGKRIAEFGGTEFPKELTETVASYNEQLLSLQQTEAERSLGLTELAPGMVLSRNIYSVSGRLLLAKGARLTSQNINRIRSIARLDSIVGNIFVQKEGGDAATPRAAQSTPEVI
jgi:putative nucleotidyltransferase with HDIG domain